MNDNRLSKRRFRHLIKMLLWRALLVKWNQWLCMEYIFPEWEKSLSWIVSGIEQSILSRKERLIYCTNADWVCVKRLPKTLKQNSHELCSS